MFRRGAMEMPHWSDGGDAPATVVSKRIRRSAENEASERHHGAMCSHADVREGAMVIDS